MVALPIMRATSSSYSVAISRSHHGRGEGGRGLLLGVAKANQWGGRGRGEAFRPRSRKPNHNLVSSCRLRPFSPPLAPPPPEKNESTEDEHRVNLPEFFEEEVVFSLLSIIFIVYFRVFLLLETLSCCMVLSRACSWLLFSLLKYFLGNSGVGKYL